MNETFILYSKFFMTMFNHNCVIFFNKGLNIRNYKLFISDNNHSIYFKTQLENTFVTFLKM